MSPPINELQSRTDGKKQAMSEHHPKPYPESGFPANAGARRPRGRIAGIDFGRARIGIAITDPDQTLASPYENYARRGPVADAQRFQRLVEEEQVTLFVVGLPVHLDGRESEISREARQFGRWLADTTGVPVEYFDEQFSTSEAHELLKQAAWKHSRRKRKLDMLAAQVMLTAFLESRAGREPSPGPC